MTKNCRFCKKDFEVAERRGPAPDYCSSACRARAVTARRQAGVPVDPVKQRAGAAAARKRWQDEVVEEIVSCSVCDEAFVRYGRSNQRYCSIRCRNRAARRRWLGRQSGS